MASSYRYSIAVQRYRYRYIRYVASDVAAYVNHWILLNLVSCTSTITTTNNSMEKSYLLGSRHGTGLQLILVVLATTTSRYPEQLLLVGTQSSCRPTKFSKLWVPVAAVPRY